ncbi:MAG: phosphate ABC transporter substrate-binding protein PstS [Leptospirales bacterium]|nr:phosphate ABC transporter substrate-binding protein PstS [Leptospirales bacterium]
MRIWKSFLIALAVLGAGACGRSSNNTLNGAGATFPFPLYGAWAHRYNAEKGIQLNYQSIGSGGGVKQITGGTVDFGASDDALPAAEIEAQGLLQWPQVIGGIVVVYNVSGVSGQLTLDGASACGIFLGEIKNFDDAAIRVLNPGLSLPSAPITVVHRSDGSGTTAVFTHYLADVCPRWQNQVGQGKAVNWPTGIGAKGNEGVMNYVRQQANSVGYVEFAYAKQNSASYANMRNRAGKVVSPSLESFSAAAAAGSYDPAAHFYTWITNTGGAQAWPITAATNILVRRDKLEASKRVVAFFDWAFTAEGDAQARELVYAPLPDSLKERVRAYWRQHGLQ